MAAIVADVGAYLLIPGASSIGLATSEAFERLMAGRLQAAQEIVFEELKSGSMTMAEVDPQEVAAVTYRYLRAAMEGAARLNLRLLAKMIAGQIAHPPLYADEFLAWAEILSSLRRDQVILLGALVRHYSDVPRESDLERDTEAVLSASEALRGELLGGAMFPSKLHLEAGLSSLMRTGFVVAASGFGSLVYRPTPALFDVARLASFEDAIRKDEREHGSGAAGSTR